MKRFRLAVAVSLPWLTMFATPAAADCHPRPAASNQGPQGKPPKHQNRKVLEEGGRIMATDGIWRVLGWLANIVGVLIALLALGVIAYLIGLMTHLWRSGRAWM